MTTTTAHVGMPMVSHPTDRPNYCEVTVQGVTIAFSYQTAVAFLADGVGFVRRENMWGPTTGKHLNYFASRDNAREVDGEMFARLLTEALNEA